MNLQQLRYLVAVADQRHFGHAADACFVSQPTLSMQLKKLEGELGVDLIERNPRNVLLTPTGEQVVERARRILADVDGIVDAARDLSDPMGGTVRIGIFPTLGPYLLPHVMPSVRDQFPKLEVLLVEEKTEELLRQLEAGQLDAAVLALPVHHSDLHEEPLFDEEFVLAVPADHPLAATSGPAPTSVLADERLLLLEEGHCLRDQALDVCRLAGAAERNNFRATSLETLRQMVAAGVGITLLPRLAVSPPVPASDAIRLRQLTDPVPSRRIAILWRNTNPRGELLRQVADVFRGVPIDLVTRADPAR